MPPLALFQEEVLTFSEGSHAVEVAKAIRELECFREAQVVRQNVGYEKGWIAEETVSSIIPKAIAVLDLDHAPINVRQPGTREGHSELRERVKTEREVYAKWPRWGCVAQCLSVVRGGLPLQAIGTYLALSFRDLDDQVLYCHRASSPSRTSRFSGAACPRPLQALVGFVLPSLCAFGDHRLTGSLVVREALRVNNG